MATASVDQGSEPRAGAPDGTPNGGLSDEGGLAQKALAQEAFDQRLDKLLSRLSPAPARIAVAVSGGGDSMALLALSADYGVRRGLRIDALTVDHALRPGSAEEARFVAHTAGALGVRHHALRWEGAKPASNLQAAARAARYGLMRDWRRRAGVGPLLLAHSQDDVAETFLLRLARGSGVDGLAAMADLVEEDPEAAPPLTLLRPLLDVSRRTLRATLEARGLGWAEDPSNADLRFDRVKARQALETLATLGLDAHRLARTAANMARARQVLERETDFLLAAAALEDADLGAATLELDALRGAPREIALRAFARALEWVAGAAYPPRLDSLERAFDALLAGGAARTLHGVLIEPSSRGVARLWREASATAPPRPLAEGATRVWDGRFRVVATRPGLRVGALGANGAAAVAARTKLQDASAFWGVAPASARAAACAVFYGAEPIACPAAGLYSEDASIKPLRLRPCSRPLGSLAAEETETPDDLA